jgi:hypothetical protein
MIKFNPENKDEVTYGEIFDLALEIKNKDEAKKYINDYAAYIVVKEKISYDDALQRAKDNLGYYAGYYGWKTRVKIKELFDAEHPLFGHKQVTSEEAMYIGINQALNSKKALYHNKVGETNNIQEKETIKFNPKRKFDLTFGEICDPASKITDKEEAKQYLKDYNYHHSIRFGMVLNESLKRVKENLKDYSERHYDAETYSRMKELFEFEDLNAIVVYNSERILRLP